MDNSLKILVSNAVAGVIVLVGTIGVLWFGAPEGTNAENDGVIADPIEAARSLEPPTAARLEQFNDLAWQSAIQRSEPTSSAQPLANRPNLRLVNLIVADSRALAVFDRPPDTKRITVAVGERLDSGVVTEITAERVLLMIGTDSFEYRLE